MSGRIARLPHRKRRQRTWRLRARLAISVARLGISSVIAQGNEQVEVKRVGCDGVYRDLIVGQRVRSKKQRTSSWPAAASSLLVPRDVRENRTERVRCVCGEARPQARYDPGLAWSGPESRIMTMMIARDTVAGASSPGIKTIGALVLRVRRRAHRARDR